MNEVIDKIDVKNQKQEKINNEKNKITFLKVVQYFIIYSVIGLIIETLFGVIIEGVVESRKNFLYGPFSCIYGVGGVVMYLTLNRFANNKYILFFGGFLLCTFIEYGVSLFGEMIYNVKWWDYTGIPFNINGRVCLLFSLIWGLMAVYFIQNLNPQIDKLLEKINTKLLKVVTIITMIFMIVNFFVTSFALKVFFARIVNDYDIQIKDSSQALANYEQWCENETFKYITDTFFSNEKMLKTFPNLRVTLKDDRVIYVSNLFPEIQSYYFKIFDVEPRDLEDVKRKF